MRERTAGDSKRRSISVVLPAVRIMLLTAWPPTGIIELVGVSEVFGWQLSTELRFLYQRWTAPMNNGIQKTFAGSELLSVLSQTEMIQILTVSFVDDVANWLQRVFITVVHARKALMNDTDY